MQAWASLPLTLALSTMHACPQPPSSSNRAATEQESANGNGGGNGAGKLRYAKLGKDPSVRTDFLPDKDREREEEELREKLKVWGSGPAGTGGVLPGGKAGGWAGMWPPPPPMCRSRRPHQSPHPTPPTLLAPPHPPPWQAEYALRTAAIKAEPLEIVYSYYNGTGHRRVVTVSAPLPAHSRWIGSRNHCWLALLVVSGLAGACCRGERPASLYRGCHCCGQALAHPSTPPTPVCPRCARATP